MKFVKIPSRFYLPILLLLYCLVRVPILLSPLEDISGEISRGWIAHDLIHGLRLPFWDYTVDSYGLGSLLAGLWTVPFFKLFGETWFALKLAPFFWHLFSVVAWYAVWKSFYSPYKAFLISLFFVLSPPFVTEYTLSNNGYHFEMILWMALSILLFKKVLEGKLSEGAGGFLLGLLGGFSSTMILTNLVMVATLLLYLNFYRGISLNKKLFFLVYFIGFGLGFSPWILFNGTYGWGGASFAFHLFSEEASLESWVFHFRLLFSKALFSLFGFRHFPAFLNVLLGSIFIGAYIFSLFRLGRRLIKDWFGKKKGLQIESFGFFFQIFLMGVSITAAVGPFPHYIFPIIPFVGMTLMLSLESLKRSWRVSLMLFWFGASVSGNLSLIHWNEMGKPLSMPGYTRHDGSIFTTLEFKFGHDLNLFRKKIQILKDEDFDFRQEIYEGLSKDICRVQNPGDIKAALAFIEETEPSLRSILYDRLGVGLGSYTRFDFQKLKQIFEDFEIPNAMQKYAYPGFIQALNWSSYAKEERLSKADQICWFIPIEEKVFCEEGKRRLDP